MLGFSTVDVQEKLSQLDNAVIVSCGKDEVRDSGLGRCGLVRLQLVDFIDLEGILERS